MQTIFSEPLIRDRIAIAYPPKDDDKPLSDMAGMAIWASVSEGVDAKIREQIKAGVFPVRLNADDWGYQLATGRHRTNTRDDNICDCQL